MCAIRYKSTEREEILTHTDRTKRLTERARVKGSLNKPINRLAAAYNDESERTFLAEYVKNYVRLVDDAYFPIAERGKKPRNCFLHRFYLLQHS